MGSSCPAQRSVPAAQAWALTAACRSKYGPALSFDDPYVRLPDHIKLSLVEAGELLEVLDIAAGLARTMDERTAVRNVAHMITTKLWPDLGGLLGGDDEA